MLWLGIEHVASFSDDRSIRTRIWEPAPSSVSLLQSLLMDHPLPHLFVEKGKGKIRQRLDSNGRAGGCRLGQLHLDQDKGIGASQLAYHQCKVDNRATPSLTIN